MEGFPRPWWVSGGWAIDLFLGEAGEPRFGRGADSGGGRAPGREHEDLEIAIFRRDQQALREQCGDWALSKAVRTPEGGEYVPWEAGEWLALPIHQILLRREGGYPPEFEVFLTEVEGEQWQFRRNLAFTRPAREIVLRSSREIPIIAPEIQLLYKANGHRDKDEHDFRQALPRLSAAQCDWLRHALEANHPDDPWVARLSGRSGSSPGS